jgi:hypothetical protein
MTTNAEQIYKELLDEFLDLVKPTMTRKEYLTCYLGTFLGRPPSFIHDKLIHTSDNMFDNIWLDQINTAELSTPEQQFMIDVLKVKDANDFINGYIEVWNKSSDLDKLGSGKLMLECLARSKKNNQ